MDFIKNVLEVTLGIVIVVILPMVIPPLREMVVGKYKSSLDKILEKEKANNDRKNYVSKVRFDKEFEIYQEMSDKALEEMFIVTELSSILKESEANSDDYYQKYQQAVLINNEANSFCRKNAPFMTKEIYESYDEFNQKCRCLIVFASNLISREKMIYVDVLYDKKQMLDKMKLDRELIVELSNQILVIARNYLQMLDVI